MITPVCGYTKNEYKDKFDYYTKLKEKFMALATQVIYTGEQLNLFYNNIPPCVFSGYDLKLLEGLAPENISKHGAMIPVIQINQNAEVNICPNFDNKKVNLFSFGKLENIYDFFFGGSELMNEVKCKDCLLRKISLCYGGCACVDRRMR